MAIDRREDAGEFYPGGKVMSTRPVATGGDMKHSDFAGIEPLPERFTDEDVRTRLDQLISAAKGASAAVVALLLGTAAFGAGVTVQTAPKGQVYNDEQIVTNVTWSADGLATPSMVTNIVNDIAPAPGNYAAVSNAAMSAVQPAALSSKADVLHGEAPALVADNYITNNVFANGAVLDQLWLPGFDAIRNWLTMRSVADELNDISQAATNYTDSVATNYLPLTGGTMTGTLTLAEVDGGNTEIIKAFLGSTSSQKFVIGVNGGNFYIGQYGYRLWLPYTSGTLALKSDIPEVAIPGTNAVLAGKAADARFVGVELAKMVTSVDGVTPDETGDVTLGAVFVGPSNEVDVGERKEGTATGDRSVVMGQNATASAANTVAEGSGTSATAQNAHAEGYGSAATNNNAHAEGWATTAGGHSSHAEGRGTKTLANYAHAEGQNTVAGGACAHAEGHTALAYGNYSHAEGAHTQTSNLYEHAQGNYNKSNPGTIDSIGIGDSTTRRNATEVMQDGRVYVYGVGGYDGTNPAAAQDVATATAAAANAATNYVNAATNGLLRTETDPTVPSWAKAVSKPSYAWGEIADKPAIPAGPTGTLSNAVAQVWRPANGEALRLTIPANAELAADSSRFLNGQSVFVAASPAGVYTVSTNITLCGYGTWPTNNFQAVFWRLDNTVFCNVIREDN